MKTFKVIILVTVIGVAGWLARRYAFHRRHHGVSFEELWRAVEDAVPKERFQTSNLTGQVCVPSLQGPSRSPHLAILLHGFSACPGVWDMLRPILISANVATGRGKKQASGHGFRVLTPTLPGHGRPWTNKVHEVTVYDGEHWLGRTRGFVRDRLRGAGQILHIARQQKTTVSYHDDLSDMPLHSIEYEDFAEQLGFMAERFKLEHPDGVVVVLGYSLGGLIAAKMALDRPRVFDRVMLMNPAFSFGHFTKAASYSLPFLRFSFPDCDIGRNSNSGGYCQFLLANVRAMVAFQKRLKVERGVAQQLKSFQMVTTDRDSVIDNARIGEFIDKVSKWHASGSEERVGFCSWPAEMSHNYIHRRDSASSDKEYWWEEYLMAKLERYLARGELLPVVDRQESVQGALSARGNMCLPSSREGVAGAVLKVLPALQRSSYVVADDSAHERVVSMVYRGPVLEEVGRFRMHSREAELLMVGDQTLLTIRLEPDAGIKDEFLIRAARRDRICVKLTLARIDKNLGLFSQLRKLHDHVDVRRDEQRKFYDSLFSDAVCSRLRCDMSTEV